MEPLIGQVMLFAGTFAPIGWMFCQGQILPISEYEALYSILGTTYGGDGITNFALPNLSGSIAVGSGTGPGLPNWALGQLNGEETSTMTQANMPAHNHIALGSSQNGEATSPQGALLAGYGTQLPPVGPYTSSAGNTTLRAGTLGNAGSGEPFSIIQPSLALNYIIAIEGIFPSPA